MTGLVEFGKVVLGITIAYFVLWMFLSSLITHACSQWWKAREDYRKRITKEVEELVSIDEIEEGGVMNESSS
jgi:hypothetical protein